VFDMVIMTSALLALLWLIKSTANRARASDSAASLSDAV
jgi:hypothetical protein